MILNFKNFPTCFKELKETSHTNHMPFAFISSVFLCPLSSFSFVQEIFRLHSLFLLSDAARFWGSVSVISVLFLFQHYFVSVVRLFYITFPIFSCLSNSQVSSDESAVLSIPVPVFFIVSDSGRSIIGITRPSKTK